MVERPSIALRHLDSLFSFQEPNIILNQRPGPGFYMGTHIESYTFLTRANSAGEYRYEVSSREAEVSIFVAI